MRYIFKVLILTLCLNFVGLGLSLAQAAEIKTISGQQLLEIIKENKGKAVLINFFATWCPSCKVATPEFVKTKEEFKDKNVLIIGVCLDNEPAKLAKYIQDFKINYPIYIGGEGLAELFQVNAIPDNMFFNVNNELMVKEAGVIQAEDLKTLITEMLKP